MSTDHAARTLTHLAQALGETLDLSAVLDRVAHAAVDFVPGSLARIWTVDGAALSLSAEAGAVSMAPGEDRTLALGQQWAGRVASTLEPLIVVDDDGVSAATVPLVAHGQLVGVLLLATQRTHRFAADELDLLGCVAIHAGIAIHTATLFARADRRRRAAEALAEVTRLMSQSLDVDDVGQRIVDSVRGLFDAVAAVLYRWDSELKDVTALSLSGDWGPVLDHVVFPAGTGLIAVAVGQRRTAATADVLTDAAVTLAGSVRERFAQSQARAQLAVPLIIRDRIIGALAIGRAAGATFDAADVALAQAFGDQAAVALQNASLFEAQLSLLEHARARRARLEALLEVGREVSRIQPPPALLERIAATCGRLLQTDSVGIRLVEGDELVVACASGGARDVMTTPRLKIGESLSGIVAATGQTLVLTDPAADPRLHPAHRAAMERLGYRALVAVPITAGERIAGVLSVQTRRRLGFSDEDIEVVTAFARQVGVALHNNRLYEELQQAYRELTSTQDQLLQSQKMEAIGRLAGGIAHDFNNLLTVIAGQTYMLRNQTAGGPVREGVERIEATAERAAELIRQLLAFSRKQVLQPGVLRLNAIVEAMVPMLTRVIGEDVELSTRLAPRLLHVKADPTQLEQVIMNLAVNARDAMPRGGRLTLETANLRVDAAHAPPSPDLGSGEYVMLGVTDTGLGMDAETRRRLFEPFYTTKEPGKGTGLGLATVYGIVQQSGGHIVVRSQPGEGATFKIYLPAVHDVVEAPETPVADDIPRGSETILVVEDEHEVRALVRQVLQERGYRVIEAGGPREALRFVTDATTSVDLLLTDVIMPQMTGRALADLLTADQPGLPVLFMSGYADSVVVEHGVLQSGRAYLQKPFTPAQLARVVRRVLDTARA
ncbi:MAG TPA: GAF domain-containing protein [Methylomirabilota bacterium]|nr:GAF domain-containing protein [Methylomirabilota bacterium]